MTGKGVSKRDSAEAVKWWRKAAEQNYAQAQYKLGLFCQTGLGTAMNLVEAYKWFSLASDQGDKDSTTGRDNVAASMTPDQIAEAQRLAREFKPHTESSASNSK